jgi:hypothetical protein
MRASPYLAAIGQGVAADETNSPKGLFGAPNIL